MSAEGRAVAVESGDGDHEWLEYINPEDGALRAVQPLCRTVSGP